VQVLLGDEEREGLVWGIGRYVGEEPTRALDIERSVRVTAAAGGLPALRYRGEARYRSVWLWLDEAADDPTLPSIAREIEAALAQAGLPVERATYWAVPEALYGADQTRIAAGELEDRQGTAVVALLTDGRKLSVRYAAGEQQGPIDTLLRALSRWPRLGFVDFGEGVHGLDRIAGKHEIPVIRPEGLVAFLTEGASLVKGKAVGDTQAWAAACALSPQPVDEATAWRLSRALGLAVTPWALRGLVREAGGEGRIAWAGKERVRMLDWLRVADGRVGLDAEQPVPAETLLGRALRFWKQELDGASAGSGTRAVKIARAALDLWDAPADAAEALYKLAGGDDGERQTDMARALRGYTAVDLPREYEGSALVVLPWRFAARRTEVRMMLQELGLGGAAAEGTQERLRRPGTMGLGIGMAAGLAAAALGIAVAKLTGQGGVVGCEATPASGLETWCEIEGTGSGRRVVARTRHAERAQLLSRTEGAVVRFEEGDDAPCEATIEGSEAVRLQCGADATPRAPRPGRKATRSVAWIEAAPHREDARALSERLIDTGTADEVILAEKDPPLAEEMRGIAGQGGQLIVIVRSIDKALLVRLAAFKYGRAAVPAADLEKLSAALGGERWAPIEQVWPAASVQLGEVQVGRPPCPSDMEWIPAGTFQMGSPEGDGAADEHPQHEVTLDAFCMDKTEVTVAAYRHCEEEARNGVKCVPAPTTVSYSGYSADDVKRWSQLCNGRTDKTDRDMHPVNCVDWNQADTYCRWAGGRLPTEAEWEYTARGTDGRTYPWGEEPPPGPKLLNACGSECRAMGNHLGGAWAIMYEADDGYESTAPVGKFPHGSSPFGLLDMAGNVWEWTADAYRRYDPGKQSNPFWSPKDGDARVRRGGSWFDSEPRLVRAANRNVLAAASRYDFVGFRCARGPKQ
jgi:formylglycine-generating enzyme required for sulfatase activity